MTLLKVLDSNYALSPSEIEAAKAKGYVGVWRYLHTLTVAEVQTYTEHDFYVGMLYEMAPAAAAGGEAQGIADARAALTQAKALHAPDGQVIAFATDVDPSSLPSGAAVAYYRGTASVVRPRHFLNGAYVGAAAANACLAAGVIDRVLVPAARSWSDGATPKRADLIQGFYVTIGSLECDNDLAARTLPMWNYRGTLNAAQPTKKEPSVADLPTLYKCTDLNGAPASPHQLVAGLERIGLDPASSARWEAYLAPHGLVVEGAYWKDQIERLVEATGPIDVKALAAALAAQVSVSGITPADVQAAVGAALKAAVFTVAAQ